MHVSPRVFLVPLLLLLMAIDSDAALLHRGTAAPVVCNFKTGVATGVGAGTCVSVLPTCDGIATDTPSFAAFRNWAINTWQASNVGVINLYIPPGSDCKYSDEGIGIFSGIKKILVSGYGTTLNGTYFHIAGDSQWQDNNHSTRIATVSAGANSVTFDPTSSTQVSSCNTNASCAALFTVGGWAVVAGIDLQTGVGFPTNPFYFQYVYITGINASTGVVTFDAPLTDTYKSTWPHYPGDGTIDWGGPATLYVFHPGWDTEVEWQGVTFTAPNPIDAPGRQVVFRDVTFTASGIACVYPTANKSFSMTNATMTNCTMEADKFVEAMSLTNVTISQIAFQSSGSSKQFTANNLTASTLVGTPQASVISNSSITGELRPGPTTYGRANSISLLNSNIGALGNPLNGAIGGIPYRGKMDEGFQNISGLSMSGGVISFPNAYINSATAQLGWAAPGNNICWSDDNSSCAQIFQITDMTQDATNTFIHTSLAGGLPSYTVGKLGVRLYPSAQFTCSGCSGDPNAVGLNSATPGAPLYSYGKRTYVNADTAAQLYWPIFGTLSKLNITVNTAYTGVLGSTLTPRTLFAQWMTTALSLVSYTPAIVNEKVGGLRSLDATGGYPATWSGAQSGDTLTTLTQALWANTLFVPNLTDISSDPSHPMSVTVEVVTNPGLVIPP